MDARKQINHNPYILTAAMIRWRWAHLHLRVPATWQRHNAERLRELEGRQ